MTSTTPKTSLDYILFAENVINGERGKVSLVNIFDSIFVKDLPAAHAPIFAVAAIRIKGEVKPTTHIVDISMTDPSGAPFINLDMQEMTSSGEDNFILNVVINLAPLPISALGEYEISIKLDGKKVASRVLKIAKEAS